MKTRNELADKLTATIEDVKHSSRILRLHLSQAAIYLLQEESWTKAREKGELVRALAELDRIKALITEITNEI